MLEGIIKALGYKLETEPTSIADAVARIQRLNTFIGGMKAKAENDARLQRERAEKFLQVADKREKRAAKADTIGSGLALLLSDNDGIADDDED